jgi:hypothetical protein
VSLRIPVPRGQSIAPANVTIVPDDNVELLLEQDATTDLAAQTVRPRTVELPARQQEPLYLRTSGDAPTLVGTIKVHSQEISSTVAAELSVDDHEVVVEERMNFHIAYEPTDHLVLSVPTAIRPDRLGITMNGQRLAPVGQREPGDAGSNVALVRVALPEPQIGRCELVLAYAVPMAQSVAGSEISIRVPLVMPSEGELTANELTVVPKSGVSAKLARGPWTEAKPTPRPANSNLLRLTASGATTEVALGVRRESASQPATTIEQAWIETRLTASQRQDRVVYRFVSGEPSVRLTLPAGAELATAEVEIDGHRIAATRDLQGGARDLVIPLGTAPAGHRLLEVRYHSSARPPRGRVALEAPQFKPGSWVQQLYWQLELPSTEHLLGAPPKYVREYRWVWSSPFWTRRPALGPRELATWIGAAPSNEVGRPGSQTNARPAPHAQSADNATNRYLFSTVGAAEPLECYTASRTSLVLFASLPLLVCGLLLIYFPVLRHPAALLVAAVITAAAILIDPESTLLVAQAASLGLALAILAFVLARVSARPAAPASSVRMQGSSRAIERPLSDGQHRPSAAEVPASTATNPLVPAAAPEGQL